MCFYYIAPSLLQGFAYFSSTVNEVTRKKGGRLGSGGAIHGTDSRAALPFYFQLAA